MLVIITLYPVLNIASVSMSSSRAVESGLVTVYPKEFTLKAYEMIFKNNVIPRGFINSIFYTFTGTLICMIMTILLAYPLSKSDLPFRPVIVMFMVITMYFSGGLLPTFLNIRRLGLYDNYLALLLPSALSTTNTMIMVTFFRNLPNELEESAYLDGANEFILLIRIVLPLSSASLATISLFYAVGKWNDWYSALIYLKDAYKFPLPMILRELIMRDKIAEMLETGGMLAGNRMVDDMNRMVNYDTLKHATLFVSMVPMLILYPFIQKYFVKGVMIGSLKG